MQQADREAKATRNAQKKRNKAAPRRRICSCGCWVMACDDASCPADLPETEEAAVAQGLVHRCDAHQSRSALSLELAPGTVARKPKCDGCITSKSHTCSMCQCFRGPGAVRPCRKCIDNKWKRPNSGPPQFPTPVRGKRSHCCVTCVPRKKVHRAKYEQKRKMERQKQAGLVDLKQLPPWQSRAIVHAWVTSPPGVGAPALAIEKANLRWPGSLASYTQARKNFRNAQKLRDKRQQQ